jgi:thiol-disulfide isomerase/thioredoxin
MRLRFAVAAAFGCMLVAATGQAAAILQVGDEPPPKLSWSTKLSDYRGKIVIVSFWASWCTPCRKELGVLAAIQKQATRDRVVVFSVNWQESAQRFQQIKHSLKDVDLTLISDESGSIGSRYGVKAIPHLVIIGRDGRIAAIHIGYGEDEIPILADEINALWNKGPNP